MRRCVIPYDVVGTPLLASGTGVGPPWGGRAIRPMTKLAEALVSSATFRVSSSTRAVTWGSGLA